MTAFLRERMGGEGQQLATAILKISKVLLGGIKDKEQGGGSRREKDENPKESIRNCNHQKRGLCQVFALTLTRFQSSQAGSKQADKENPHPLRPFHRHAACPWALVPCDLLQAGAQSES